MFDCQLLSFTGQDGVEREFGLFQLQASMLSNTTTHGNATMTNNTDPVSDTFSVSQDCVDYNWRDEESATLRTAQVSNLLAIVGGGVGFLLVMFETCCLRVCCARVLELSAYSMAILFSGLVFLALQAPVCDDNGGCTTSRGAIFNIAATALYGFSVIIMMCTPKPKPFLRQVCCGHKNKTQEEAVSIAEPISPTQPGKLEVEEGAWGATPHGRTQYE